MYYSQTAYMNKKKRCRPDFLPHLLLSYFYFYYYYYYFSSFLSSNFFFCSAFDWLSDRLFGRFQVVLSTRLYTLLEIPSSSDYVYLFLFDFFGGYEGGGGGARLNATWRSAQAFAVNICLIFKFFSFACIEWGMECQTYILICFFSSRECQRVEVRISLVCF